MKLREYYFLNYGIGYQRNIKFLIGYPSMDVLILIEQSLQRGKIFVHQFFYDAMRLVKASPIFGGLVIVTGIVLAFFPILFWQYVAHFIDSAYGARGIGTMTSDLSHAATMMMVTLLVILMAISYAWQTRGLSRKIIVLLTGAGILITHALVLFALTRGFLVCLVSILVIARVIDVMKVSLMKKRCASYIIAFCTIILGLATWNDTLHMMTVRSITVGNMVEYSGVLLMLTGGVAAGIARKNFFAA